MTERPTRCLICEARLHNPICQLPADSLSRFAESSTTITYRTGQTIFSQGDVSGDIFIVRTGQVRLTHYHSDGAEQVLRIAGPGEILGAGISGERCLIMTARTKSTATVCRSKLKDVESLVERDPKFALAWGHLLMDEVRRARNAVFHLGPHPAGVRMARLLHEMSRRDSSNGGGPPTIQVTHADLASSLAIAQETATRLLADLQEQNVVKLNRGRIEVLDADLLVALAGYPGLDPDLEKLA